MSKKYFIVSVTKGSERNICDVVTFLPGGDNAGGREATDREAAELRLSLDRFLPAGMYDALRKRHESYPPRIFDTRKAARKATADLVALDSPFFFWQVREFGDKTKRDLREVDGWRVLCNGRESIANHGGDKTLRDGRKGFSTRKQARHTANVLRKTDCAVEFKYTVGPVYA